MSKFIAIQEYYYDCPSCNGSADSHLQAYDSMRDLVDTLLSHSTIKIIKIYNVSPLYEICEVGDNCGEHRIKSRVFYFGKNRFELMMNGENSQINKLLTYCESRSMFDTLEKIKLGDVACLERIFQEE